jgi:hypothetical protein
MPPTPAFTGLEDLGDDMAGPAVSLNDSPFENPDFVLDNDALEAASPDTAADEIEPGVPAQPVEPKKKTGPTIIDWSKATPRKEDTFTSTPVGQQGSPTTDAIRDFLNNARQNGWYDLYYPVLEYGSRNSAQPYVTKINQWRKGKTNTYGVRDGENISAKCERQAADKYVVWVGLLKDPGAKGEVNPPEKTISATPEAE